MPKRTSETLEGQDAGPNKRFRSLMPTSLLEYLNGLRNDNESLCDVVFVVEGERFPCHKVVLAAASPVFKKMFTNGMLESKEREINLGEVRKSVWKVVLDFLYSDELQYVSYEIGMSIWECARKYELVALERTITEYLISESESESTGLSEFMKLVEEHEAQEVLKLIHAAVEKRFYLGWNTRFFFFLPVKLIENLFGNDSLKVSSEIVVFRAILFWLTGEGREWDKDDEDIETLLVRRKSFDYSVLQLVKPCRMEMVELKEVAQKAKQLNKELWNEAVSRLVLLPLPTQSFVNCEHYVPRRRDAMKPITIVVQLPNSFMDRKFPTQFVRDLNNSYKCRLVHHSKHGGYIEARRMGKETPDGVRITGVQCFIVLKGEKEAKFPTYVGITSDLFDKKPFHLPKVPLKDVREDYITWGVTIYAARSSQGDEGCVDLTQVNSSNSVECSL